MHLEGILFCLNVKCDTHTCTCKVRLKIQFGELRFGELRFGELGFVCGPMCEYIKIVVNCWHLYIW